MKRSAALAPLSRDHHRALEIALRMRRADEATLADVTSRFRSFWSRHGEGHFDIEEQVLVPALPADDAEWREGCRRMLAEHAEMRRHARALCGPAPSVEGLRQLGQLLHDHIRFEERELFALLERRLPGHGLRAVGE